MVDIHAHILPGLDDGADRTRTSLRMAESAAQSGVTDLIATPHCNQRGRFENYASEALTEQYLRLKELLQRERIALRLHLGMEVFATRDTAALLRDGKLLTLAGSRYLLVEFGFRTDAHEMERILREVTDAGAVPVLAHPERYPALQVLPDVLEDWVRAGVHLQINKGSLSGYFGREPFALAETMLEHDLASFVASDAHRADRRTPALRDTYRWIASRYSEQLADRLLRRNPERVLRNEPLIACSPIPLQSGRK